MPASSAKISANYIPVAQFATAPAAAEGIIAGEDKAIVTDCQTEQGTVKYFATTAQLEQAPATTAEGWTATVPTAAGYTGDITEDFTVYVYYFIDAADGYADTEVFGPIAVTVVRNMFDLNFKEGTPDVNKWTITQEGKVKVGTTVTLQYNGRLKVKGVKATSDAAPAKEPATVTTAPTGAAIVGVGKTTALVSGGVADGGTLMYAVTTTNTKPTSTAGFSDAVPTAQTITASGKVYVWYYVKADDSHSDSEIAATAIEVPVADIVWDRTNITDLRVMGTRLSYTNEGVKLSGNADDIVARWRDKGDPTTSGIQFDAMESGGYTFTAPTGKKFTKIVMTLTFFAGWDNANLGSGWSYSGDDMTEIYKVTWTGTAASTVGLLTGADHFSGEIVKSIVFYLSE
jgi:hypothetical protein